MAVLQVSYNSSEVRALRGWHCGSRCDFSAPTLICELNITVSKMDRQPLPRLRAPPDDCQPQNVRLDLTASRA